MRTFGLAAQTTLLNCCHLMVITISQLFKLTQVLEIIYLFPVPVLIQGELKRDSTSKTCKVFTSSFAVPGQETALLGRRMHSQGQCWFALNKISSSYYTQTPVEIKIKIKIKNKDPVRPNKYYGLFKNTIQNPLNIPYKGFRRLPGYRKQREIEPSHPPPTPSLLILRLRV